MPKLVKIRPANTWWQRWRRRWRHWRGAGQPKAHQVDLVEVDGRQLKRVIFDSSATAAAVVHALRASAPIGRFPRVLMHEGRQVRVEFVPGPLAQAGRDEHELLAFFVDLYAMPARQVSLTESNLVEALAKDLGFLVAQGLIGRSLAERLKAAGQSVSPPSILTGFDYIDPVLKNFVICQGRAIAVDIEALMLDQPLGTGLAKARLRWMRSMPGSVLDAICSNGGPDLRAQYPLVELAFLSSYFRQKIIQRKRGHIRIEALHHWLADRA